MAARTHFMVSPQLSTYKNAIKNIRNTNSCKDLKRLSLSKEFELHELAVIRYAQHCTQRPSWKTVEAEVSRPSSQKLLKQVQFEQALKDKNYLWAYQLYQKNPDFFTISNKEFSEMAVKLLKNKLSTEMEQSIRTELYDKAPRFIATPQPDEYLKVAKDFRGDRQFDKALFYYRKVINSNGFSDRERWLAFRGARLTYKLERWSRKKKYLKASKQWAHFFDNRYNRSNQHLKMHHDSNIEYVRTLWTEVGQKQALPALLRLEKQIKNRYSLQMVYWLKGRMAEERKDNIKATYWLSRAAQQPMTRTRNYDRVLWSLAWNQRKLGQYKESIFNLKKLLKSKELSFFAKTKYLYWKAENLKSMGRIKASQKAFQGLAELDGYGYYGALSLRNLNKKFPHPPKRQFNKSKILSFYNEEDRSYIQSLVEVEEYDVSKSFTSQHIKEDKSWSAKTWVQYLSLLQWVGAYKTFFVKFHSLPPKKQLVVMEDHPYLLFPQPYKNQVDDAALTEKVSSSLIYSIMKQESGFDVRARSHADAFGLLQLIPQVARKTAEKKPYIHYRAPQDLYNPDVIIPLGASTLHQLFSKFHSNFILSVASYNASEKAVRNWVKTRYSGDPVSFIEEIPYEETKGYIKLVMRNYITYNRFDNPQEAFQFPEICLQGLERFQR